MLSLRAIILFQILLCTAAAQALTVQLAPYDEYCGNANGYIICSVSGGTPPYTYSWSNAETTSNIYNLASGIYSVTVTDFVGTQVTQQATVNAQTAFPPTNMGGAGAYCPPYSYTLFSTVGLTELNLSVPIQTPVSLSAFTEEMTWSGDLVVLEPGTPGWMAQFTYFDATGCPGTVTLHYGFPVQFSQAAVLNVEGSCASSATGSITAAYTAEGSHQLLDLELRRANGQLITVVGIGSNASVRQFTNLLPGDYWLVQRIPDLGSGMNASYFHDYCGDSI
ncbi:MAG TPA: SprB repeat-containing protein, partial [Flavobacteriales bacterium]|nr:SprB repeat-containing protein [Flavobacteriales bacterium]